MVEHRRPNPGQVSKSVLQNASNHDTMTCCTIKIITDKIVFLELMLLSDHVEDFFLWSAQFSEMKLEQRTAKLALLQSACLAWQDFKD